MTACKDCAAAGRTNKRPTPHPGPRCHSCHRERRVSTRNISWERRLLALYGLLPEEYYAVLSYQGNVCAICQRATGARKRLAVDHDHATGYNRGCLCQPCNRLLGHLRDDPDAFVRAANYLLDPPAFSVIGRRYAPVTELGSKAADAKRSISDASALTKNGQTCE